jgi:hypothetical protein
VCSNDSTGHDGVDSLDVVDDVKRLSFPICLESTLRRARSIPTDLHATAIYAAKTCEIVTLPIHRVPSYPNKQKSQTHGIDQHENEARYKHRCAP